MREGGRERERRRKVRDREGDGGKEGRERDRQNSWFLAVFHKLLCKSSS